MCMIAKGNFNIFVKLTIDDLKYSVLPLNVRLPSGNKAIVPPSLATFIQFKTAPTSFVCFLIGIGATANFNNLDINPLENKSSLAI